MNDLMKTLLARYPALFSCREAIECADKILLRTHEIGGKILLCGNGGSAADCDHIAGELLKGFLLKRPMKETEKEKFQAALGDGAKAHIDSLQRGIKAISLPAQSAVLSAFANDVDAEFMYAQLVFAYASAGDTLIAISTSGNSKNVVRAAEAAHALGISVIGLTGERESKLSSLCDTVIRVPATETYQVQEYHLPVYHYLCASLENVAFGSDEIKK